MIRAERFVFLGAPSELRPLHHHNVIRETVLGQIAIEGFDTIRKVSEQFRVSAGALVAAGVLVGMIVKSAHLHVKQTAFRDRGYYLSELPQPFRQTIVRILNG